MPDLLIRRRSVDYGPYSFDRARRFLADGQLHPQDAARLVGTSHANAVPLIKLLNCNQVPPANGTGAAVGLLRKAVGQFRGPGTLLRHGSWARILSSLKSRPARLAAWFRRWRLAIASWFRRWRLAIVALGMALLGGVVWVNWPAPRPPSIPIEKLASPANWILDAETEALALGPCHGLNVDQLAAKMASCWRGGGPAPEIWRARLIYRWVAEHITYEVRSLWRSRIPPWDGASVLKRRQGVCQGYAQLYLELARKLGLSAELIGGTSRSAENLTGGPISDDDASHAWNAVQIDGTWRLLDVTWGAGSVGSEGFKKKYRAAWFDLPPADFVRRHFPTETKWQLLSPAISRKEFDEFPWLAPEFFQYVTFDRALLRGTLVHRVPLLEIKTNEPVQWLARSVQPPSSNEAPLELVSVPEPARGLTRTTITAPANVNAGTVLYLYARRPNDPEGIYAQVAIYRLAKHP